MGFWEDLKWFMLFYVIGDFITTTYAIEAEMGYEGNNLVSDILTIYGYAGLLGLKVLMVVFMYVMYWSCEHMLFAGKYAWKAVRLAATIVGIVIVLNNVMVIMGYEGVIATMLNSGLM